MALEQNVLLGALGVLVLLVVVGAVMLLRLKGAIQQQVQGQAAIQTDLRALCNAAVQVGERVNRMEGEIQALQQRQQELGVRQDKIAHSEPQEVSFEQAIRMARKGSSTEELMEVCNLSRGEAELIAMMHRLEPSVQK